MNLQAIANAAGVSVSTVSKAFSGSREISHETRERIFAIARKNGCFDRYNKNKFPKHIIAVLLPELVSEHYGAIGTLLDREITAAGGVMVASTTDFSVARTRELFDYYASYARADGIILVDPRGKVNNTGRTPAVAFSRIKQKNIDNIILDFYQGIEDCIRYLKELGHTEIGFAGEQLTSGKQKHVCDAMRRLGLPIKQEHIKITQTRFERAGEELAAAWLKDGRLPTAIITAYDHIAIGIIRYFLAHGVRVPEDVSVIGMDDIPVAPYFSTSLTSIHVYAEEACRTAVELILKKIKNQYYSTREEIVFPATFIARESSGKAPQ